MKTEIEIETKVKVKVKVKAEVKTARSGIPAAILLQLIA